ncbi:MAG: hypothetical protein ACMUIG_07525 [Thermoplasmatota archaeon]
MTLDPVKDRIWDIDSCLDSHGNNHLVYCSQEGLVFAEYRDNRIRNSIVLTDSRRPSNSSGSISRRSAASA